MRTISALCVAPRSNYKQLEDLECYDAKRDARTFPGDTPIVAHPPCRSWSRFTKQQSKPPPGEKELAPLCVEFLRRCGGIREHPAHSHLWDHCNLPAPGQSTKDFWCEEVRTPEQLDA